VINTLIGYDEDKRFNLQMEAQNSIVFSDLSVIEGFNTKKEHILFFLPLFFNENEIGALLISYNPNIPHDIYETLRISITSAIKSADLLSTYRVLSITDELTKVFNRRGFYQIAESRLSNMSRENDVKPIVLFMDLDGLKTINDTYGHNEGDIAIKAFSQVLQLALRKGDIIGRIGGDEFCVLSSIRSTDQVKLVENRIRNEIKKYNAKKLHPYDVMASFGCVILDSPSMSCLEEAMLNADMVLYDEKARKRKSKKLAALGE
jgi:diguanylate cyclase (GGDEF)-like protein